MQTVTLSQICSRLNSGSSIAASMIKEAGKYPVYGGNGLRGYTDTYNFDGECALIGRQGEQCGNVRYFVGKGYMTEHAIVLCTKENVDTKYIACLLSLLNLRRLSGQSAQPGLSVNTLGNLKIDCLPYSQQVLIGNTIKKIDRKIANNEAVNNNLEQVAKTIYDYWFMQFDFPDENGKPYRSSGGQMIWNEQLKRKIPVGWEVASIIDNPLSTVIKPGVERFSSKEYLATANVNGTDISQGTCIGYETRESRANMQPTVNSIWFAKMKNSVKHLFFNEQMRMFIDNVILSTGFCGIQCTEESFEYLASFISNARFETVKDTLAHGATQEAVNNDDMLSIKLLVPEMRVINLFHEVCKDIYAEKSKNICENRLLMESRDWLLPLLMSGQATVAD